MPIDVLGERVRHGDHRFCDGVVYQVVGEEPVGEATVAAIVLAKHT
jgi:hypothetical protein